MTVEGRSALAKGLAIVGTILVWFPIAATVVLSAAGSIRSGALRIDYLMPAEFSPVGLLGGVVLAWAAIRARSHRRAIGWSLGMAIGLLVGSQLLAVVTGLASGAVQPAGWRVVLVSALLAGYVLALLGMGASGVSLVRALFRAEAPVTG